jgi:hypothetical protein
MNGNGNNSGRIDQEEDGPQEHAEAKRRHGFIPPHIIRQLARGSSEGGRARCHYCITMFSVTYMRVKKVGPFEEDWVCRDCEAEHS